MNPASTERVTKEITTVYSGWIIFSEAPKKKKKKN